MFNECCLFVSNYICASVISRSTWRYKAIVFPLISNKQISLSKSSKQLFTFLIRFTPAEHIASVKSFQECYINNIDNAERKNKREKNNKNGMQWLRRDIAHRLKLLKSLVGIRAFIHACEPHLCKITRIIMT